MATLRYRGYEVEIDNTLPTCAVVTVDQWESLKSRFPLSREQEQRAICGLDVFNTLRGLPVYVAKDEHEKVRLVNRLIDAGEIPLCERPTDDEDPTPKDSPPA